MSLATVLPRVLYVSTCFVFAGLGSTIAVSCSYGARSLKRLKAKSKQFYIQCRALLFGRFPDFLPLQYQQHVGEDVCRAVVEWH